MTMGGYWKRLCQWLSDFGSRHILPWTSLCAAISGVFVTYDFSHLKSIYPSWSGAFELFSNGFLFWLFLVTTILTTVISWLAANRQKSIDKLTAEVEQIGQNIRVVFDALLLNLARRLGIEREEQTRLSIYIHDKKHKNFIPCGRYSPNPKFCQPGRTTYPDSQGCIREGWEKGWHFDGNFPTPTKEHAQYCHSQYGIGPQTHRRIRMKSSLYAVLRLDDFGGRGVAVLVIETMQMDRFDEQLLRDSLLPVIDDFAELIRTFYAYIPNPNEAAAREL